VLAPATPVNPSTFIEIDIHTGRRIQSFWYWVSPAASDFGRAFTFEPSAATPPEECAACSQSGIMGQPDADRKGIRRSVPGPNGPETAGA
jgi:hypothetical protein